MECLYLEVVQDPLAVVEGEFFAPGQDLDGRQHPVDRVEVLEAHPVREAASHQVYRLEDLEGANLRVAGQQ